MKSMASRFQFRAGVDSIRRRFIHFAPVIYVAMVGKSADVGLSCAADSSNDSAIRVLLSGGPVSTSGPINY